MASDRSDFVDVRLTDAGQKLAGANPLLINNGRRSFTFNGATPLEVERSYEWKAILSRCHTATGEALVEIAPKSPDTGTQTSSKQPSGAAPATVAPVSEPVTK